MKVVIDTSALLAVLLNEPHRQNIIELTRGTELYAPASLHWEVSNAFSAMFKQNRLSLEQAQTALQAYRHIPIRFEEIDLSATLNLAWELNIYAYDAYLLVCAQYLNAPLITLDKKLSTSASVIGIKILEV